MDEVECRCGAAGRIVAVAGADGPTMEWRGGRVGSGRIVLEKARPSESVCPACQHREAVYVLVDRGRT